MSATSRLWSIPKAQSEWAEEFTPARILACAVLLAIAGAAVSVYWAISGNEAPMRAYVQYAAEPSLAAMALVGAWLAWAVSLRFGGGSGWRTVWRLLAFSAGFRGVGYLLIGWLGQDSGLNPLRIWDGGSDPRVGASLQVVGRAVSEWLALPLLAAGLWRAIRKRKPARMLLAFRAWDIVLGGILAFWLTWQFDLFFVWLKVAREDRSAGEYLRWCLDPLVAAMLVQTVILRRAGRQGEADDGRTWEAFFWGLLLTQVGYGLLPPDGWSAAAGGGTWFGWLVWVPATAAFAIAPACELRCIGRGGK